MTDDIRELQKWLNEEPNRPLDKAALARALHQALRLQTALHLVVSQLRSATPDEPCNCMASKHWPDCSFSLYAAALQAGESALQAEPELVKLESGAVHGLDPKVAKAFGARPVTAAEMRLAAAHDTSCVGAFARARPGKD